MTGGGEGGLSEKAVLELRPEGQQGPGQSSKKRLLWVPQVLKEGGAWMVL